MLPDLHGPPQPHTDRLPGGHWVPAPTSEGHLPGAVWVGEWITLCSLRWDAPQVPMTFPLPVDFGDEERLRAAEEKRAKRMQRGIHKGVLPFA